MIPPAWEPTLLTLGSGLVVAGTAALNLDKIVSNARAGATIWKGMSHGVRSFVDRSGEREHRIELISQLFRVSGCLHIPAPADHPLFHGKGAHDTAAMEVAIAMLKNPSLTDALCEASLMPYDTIFIAGSPNSSALSAAFIPADGSAPPRGALVTNASEIPYHIFEGAEEGPVIKSSALEGRERKVRIRGLTCGTDRWYPPRMADEDSRLKTDYLLLSVIPWNENGGRAVFAGGGHGVGTHALKLLLDRKAFPFAALEKLVSDVEGSRNFQIVFEVSVRHDGTFSMPSGIKVSPDLAPKKISSATSLFSKPEDDVRETVLSFLRQKSKGENAAPDN